MYSIGGCRETTLTTQVWSPLVWAICKVHYFSTAGLPCLPLPADCRRDNMFKIMNHQHAWLQSRQHSGLTFWPPSGLSGTDEVGGVFIFEMDRHNCNKFLCIWPKVRFHRCVNKWFLNVDAYNQQSNWNPWQHQSSGHANVCCAREIKIVS